MVCLEVLMPLIVINNNNFITYIALFTIILINSTLQYMHIKILIPILKTTWPTRNYTKPIDIELTI